MRRPAWALAVVLLAAIGVGAAGVARRRATLVDVALDAGAQVTVPESPSGPAAPVSLRGHVLGATGDPVVEASVRVLAGERLLAETRTDGAGRFTFATLEGRVEVEADHDPEGAVVSAAIDVARENTKEITLVLSPAAVVGLVVDADNDRPVANATLTVEGVPFLAQQATTDLTGAFRFGAVPFEARAVFAVAPGYRPLRLGLGAREGQPAPTLRFALQGGAPAEGEVLDADGKPVQAHVVACEGQPTEVHAQSGSDGTFELPVQAFGCDAFATRDEMGASDSARVLEGRRVMLRLQAPGSIAGVVVDDRGDPIDPFMLGVESFVPARGKSGARRGATAFHGGAFELDKMVPGTYVLSAVTAGRPPARSGAVTVASRVRVDGVRLVVTRGGTFAGRVTDTGGTPLPDVEIRFDTVSSVVDSDAVARTDAAGRYQLEGAPGGLLTLRARKDGYRTRLVAGLVAPNGRTVARDIVLTAVDGGPGLELGGIGASPNVTNGSIVFAGVSAGNPAEHAGLRPGDVLQRIDGEDIAGMSLADAIQHLRGEPGTVVGVTVSRNGASVDILITRGTVLF